MVCTYENYLETPKCISLEKCFEIHRMMVEEIGNEEDAIELYDEIVEKACEYAEIRAKWTLMDKEWKMDADPGRTFLTYIHGINGR